MNYKVIQIDTRGSAMDIALRISQEPYIRDLTTVSFFIDSQYFTICEIIAKFWQSQIGNQKQSKVSEVQTAISQLIDGAFCRSGLLMSAPQLQSLKTAFFQALTSSFYSRVGNTGEVWDQVELVRLDMDSYVLRCTKTAEGAMSFQTPELSFMSIR